MKNILVYCGASVGFDEIYKNTAIAAGKLLVEKTKRLFTVQVALVLWG
jgi:hypothetical protein